MIAIRQDDFQHLPGFHSGKDPNGRKKMILFCQGGAGDVLSHTPMIRHWRNKYPDDYLVVTCTYPDLLRYNPNIDELLPLSDTGGVYEKHMLDKEYLRFYKKHFVYDHLLDPRFAAKTLPEFICNVYGAEYDGDSLDYVVTDDENTQAKYFMGQFGKPVILMHAYCSVPTETMHMNKSGTHKDLPVEHIAPFVEKYNKKFDFVQIGLIGEPTIPGSIDCLGMAMREVIPLISRCASFIFVESLFAHCANALNKTGTVICNNMNTDFFGHPTAINVGNGAGCKHYPCNRPLGSLIDIQKWFRNPKTRERALWKCENQVCNKVPLEQIEEAFLESLKIEDVKNAEKEHKGANPKLEELRNQPPPPKPPEEPPVEFIREGDTR